MSAPALFPTPTTIELIYFDAGGGHRSAMKALSSILATSCPNVSVKATNLQTLLKCVDPVFRAAGIPSEQIYNSAVRRGWTRGSKALLRGLQTGIRMCAPQMRSELSRHWRQQRCDMVVSLVPNFNSVMFDALRDVDVHVPYVSIMTDIADSPPSFWQEPQDQFLICGSEKAYLQALLTGWYRPERVHKTSGMIIHPAFYSATSEPLPNLANLGLDPSLPTALIMFGGNGSNDALKILDWIEASGIKAQSIVMCGRNEPLRRALEGHRSCLAVPFTDRVMDYMRLADFYIGKPGPGSISEAIHCGLPTIVESNAGTLYQERYNAIWLEERGLGLCLPAFHQLPEALRYLLSDDRLTQYQRRASNLQNRAIFEIPIILNTILKNSIVSGGCVQAGAASL